MTETALQTSAEQIVGEPLEAAGLFKLHEDVAALFAGGAIGTMLPNHGSAAATGAESDAGADAARAIVAHKKGLTPEMVVGVSENFVHVLSVPSTAGNPVNPLAALGMAEPGQELMRFDRASADIGVKKHLRRVYLKLSDDQHSVGLVSAQTESVSGGKQVAAALDG